jgi:palmitoyl-protein thioesterase
LFQKFLTPASYWHDDENEERYRRGSSFLAVINNENHYNADYVKNLKSLKRMILVKFMKDVSLIPNESSHFGFTTKNGTAIPMELTHTYRNDRLGLKSMSDEGKLIRLESPLEHLELNKVWFRDKIVPVLKEKQ